MFKTLKLLIIFLATFFYLTVISPQIQVQSEENLPQAPDTGTPTEESVPGGTRGPWSAEIAEIEDIWTSLYRNYLEQDFLSLKLEPLEISTKIAELNQATGIKAAIVWLIPRPDYLSILLVTPGKSPIGSRVSDANQESLFSLITQFQIQVSNPQSLNYLLAAQKLYQWIISPIEYHLLTNNIDTLILCVGPKLRSLPFAALHDGKEFLLEKYNLSLIPGFNLTQWEGMNLQNAEVLAMGASQFTDHPPLPGVEMEIAMIEKQGWPTENFFNQEFTVPNLKSELTTKTFSLVHLATHSQFQGGSVDNSYLQFFDSRLSLRDMPKLPWSQAPVDLLVLSACETARGNVQAELGFIGLALNAGVKGAIGSLWRVSDVGTLGIMSEFYRHLRQIPQPVSALRKSQLALLNQEIVWKEGVLLTPDFNYDLTETLNTAEEVNLSHPYFWAGFTFIGNPFSINISATSS
jgi:CHAT domain-containing protein